MSNVSEDKRNLIFQAAIKILVDDNADTSLAMREIEFYVNDRIQQEDSRVQVDFPKIDILVEDGASEISLPTSEFFLEIVPKTQIAIAGSKTDLNRITGRSMFLFDGKPESLNASLAAVSSIPLRCRLLQKQSALPITDAVLGIYSNTIRFLVQCDDEIIN